MLFVYMYIRSVCVCVCVCLSLCVLPRKHPLRRPSGQLGRGGARVLEGDAPNLLKSLN